MTRILLTNDDGISSPGLAALRRALESLGEVTTIAPDGNRSAVARAITTDRTLHARKVAFGDGFQGIALDGTPVDCVRAALMGSFCAPPHVVVAGVNLGPNMGEDVTYSGTVGAALEGALVGLVGVAVSTASRRPRHLDAAVRLALPIIARAVGAGLPPGVALNVNVPDRPLAEVAGVEVTRLGCASYHDEVVIEHDDGRSQRYRVTSEMSDCEQRHGTDFAAVAGGRVSVTPLRTDWLDEGGMPLLEAWNLPRLVLGHDGDRPHGAGAP